MLDAVARVLVQLVGKRRNAGKGPDRPAMRLALASYPAGPLQEIELVGDPTLPNCALTEDLAAELKRRGQHVRTRKMTGLDSSTDGHVLGSARKAIAPVVEEVVARHIGHLRRLEILVSVESGTAAQQVALAEGFAAHGVAVGLVMLEGRSPAVRVAAEPRDTAGHLARPTDPEAMVPHLAHLPPGRTVLLTGPTGAGKSRVARRLHQVWNETERPFVHLNCAAVPRDLLESELFGHEKGAFTGAVQSKQGALERAAGGTLFMDEIGDLPLALQSKLLTALDHSAGTRTFLAVGGGEPRTTDARIVFATNRDLASMVAAGEFRDDVLARISSWIVKLPPLSVRRFDVLRTYLHAFDDLRPIVGGAPLILARPASLALIRFAYAPTSVWRWNHRDVLQSAERLVLRSWGEAGYPQVGTKPLVINREILELEFEELAGRWQEAGPEGEAGAERWGDLEEVLDPVALAEMSELERWEARYLLRAQRATRSKAEAWRYVVEQRLLPLKRSGEPANPTNAFTKRWAKFRWA